MYKVVIDMLTEKQKSFCREYFSNGGNATQAYLSAYDSKSEASAAQEGYRLLQSDSIQEYIQSLNKPLEIKAQSEREKKRTILWDFINDTNKSDSDRLKALDLLNKMDSEYTNVNHNINETVSDITTLDTKTLKLLSGS